jgi:hypothetical protein
LPFVPADDVHSSVSELLNIAVLDQVRDVSAATSKKGAEVGQAAEPSALGLVLSHAERANEGGVGAVRVVGLAFVIGGIEAEVSAGHAAVLTPIE